MNEFLLKSRDNIFLFYCPACGCCHWINDTWSIQQNELGAITVTPSIKVESPHIGVCHLFIKNNQIEYLSDCTHKLAGKTIPMESME